MSVAKYPLTMFYTYATALCMIFPRTYDTLGDICPILERPELCFKAAVTILVW